MNIKKKPYRRETTFVYSKAICIVLSLLFLSPALSRGAQGEKEIPTRWFKISYMDLTMQLPCNIEIRSLDLAYGLTPVYGLGFGVSVFDVRGFYSIVPSKLGAHASLFPVSLYYAPTVRWTPNYHARPIMMLFLTYGRMWFPEGESTYIANQNSITSGCFVAWQKGIPLGLKASIVYTFSDDGETTCFTFGVGGIISFGMIKGIARKKTRD